MHTQKGKFEKITQLETAIRKDGSVVLSKNGYECKKAQVFVSFQEQGKNGTFQKGLVPQMFGEYFKVQKQYDKVVNNFSQGDEVILSFYLESKRTKNGDFFPDLKFAGLEHADKQQQSQSSWMGDDQQSNQPSQKSNNSILDDDNNLPF